METSSNATTIGPKLPPGFGARRDETSASDQNSIEPELPPNFKRYSGENSEERKDCYGPSLPPHMKTNISYGPTLPPSFTNRESNVIGPVLPNLAVQNSDDSDEESIGPKLHEAADAKTQSESTAADDFERRAEKMKNKLLSQGTEVKKREEWMTELPSRLGPQIGLGPRSFKKHSYIGKNDDDRSEWTDTPADRKRKAEMQENVDERPCVSDVALETRNREITENLQKFNKTKRKESLLEMHQKKRKSNKNEKTKQERKEFDRDKDLNITKLDAAQAKSFIDKARLLNGKFSHGSNHFL